MTPTDPEQPKAPKPRRQQLPAEDLLGEPTTPEDKRRIRKARAAGGTMPSMAVSDDEDFGPQVRESSW